MSPAAFKLLSMARTLDVFRRAIDPALSVVVREAEALATSIEELPQEERDEILANADWALDRLVSATRELLEVGPPVEFRAGRDVVFSTEVN